ncbi:MAG TPA: ribosomal protein L13e [Candidatus Methanofastidiosa archaeon]|nr:ribosomal protein L13e [Candidatus Methanofastidiosa archaeon]
MHKMRNGRGFSKKELEEAGLTVDDALWMGIPVDVKRRTLYEENVETISSLLEQLKVLQEEYEEQKKAELARQEEVRTEKEKDSKKKKKAKPEKKPKKEKPAEVEEVVEEEPVEEESEESIPLEMIPGVGPKTAERLVEAGYSTVDDIMNATAEQLAEIKGISEKSAKEIIEKAKGL